MDDTMVAAVRKHLEAIEVHVAKLRELVGSHDGPPGSDDPYAAIDFARRRRPEWRKRGRLLDAVDRAGGKIGFGKFEAIVRDCGYGDLRAVNPMFRGSPPVLDRTVDEVFLTERGKSAARFYRSYWKGRST